MEHNQANGYPVNTTFIFIKKPEKIKKITIHYEYFTEERKRKD